MALDSNIAALLTVDVAYEAKSGVDEYGQEQFADPVTLKCYPTLGSRQITRRDGTVYVSQMTLTFDAADATVAAFQLGDRFTAPGIAGGQQLEAQSIEGTYSPGPSIGQPQEPWLVEVIL